MKRNKCFLAISYVSLATGFLNGGGGPIEAEDVKAYQASKPETALPPQSVPGTQEAEEPAEGQQENDSGSAKTSALLAIVLATQLNRLHAAAPSVADQLLALLMSAVNNGN